MGPRFYISDKFMHNEEEATDSGPHCGKDTFVSELLRLIMIVKIFRNIKDKRGGLGAIFWERQEKLIVLKLTLIFLWNSPISFIHLNSTDFSHQTSSTCSNQHILQMGLLLVWGYKFHFLIDLLKNYFENSHIGVHVRLPFMKRRLEISQIFCCTLYLWLHLEQE